MMPQREIEIQRNPIERVLMAAKDIIRKNRRGFLYGLIGVIAAAGVAIGLAVYFSHRAGVELAKFEAVMEEYRATAALDPDTRAAKAGEIAEKLKAIIDGSWLGYVNSYGKYYLGAVYFENGRYAEAKECYRAFGSKSSSEIFAPLALQQAARCAEMQGNLKEALEIGASIEKRFSESELADQILYDIARLNQRNGDIFKAREYYNKIIISFPQSLYAKKAKDSLFLLGYYEGRKKTGTR